MAAIKGVEEALKKLEGNGVRRSQDCRTAPAHRNPPAHRGNHSRSIPYQSRALDRNSAHSPTASRDN